MGVEHVVDSMSIDGLRLDLLLLWESLPVLLLGQVLLEVGSKLLLLVFLSKALLWLALGVHDSSVDLP